MSTDPEFSRKAADVIGLYLNPPQNALVLCVDEKPYIDSAETANDRHEAAAGKISQVCLVPVCYDQGPKDRETDGLADQSHSSCDPLHGFSHEQPVGHSDFRL